MSLSWKALLFIAGIWRSAVSGDASILPNSQFETLSYEGIVREVMVLAAEYPHLAQVTEQSINCLYSKTPVIRYIQEAAEDVVHSVVPQRQIRVVSISYGYSTNQAVCIAMKLSVNQIVTRSISVVDQSSSWALVGRFPRAP